jgi:hypothetical protein
MYRAEVMLLLLAASALATTSASASGGLLRATSRANVTSVAKITSIVNLLKAGENATGASAHENGTVVVDFSDAGANVTSLTSASGCSWSFRSGGYSVDECDWACSDWPQWCASGGGCICGDSCGSLTINGYTCYFR